MAVRSSSKTRRRALSPGLLGCAVVFSLPFAAGGLWAAFLAASAFLDGMPDKAFPLGVAAFMALLFAGLPFAIAWGVGTARAEGQETAVRRGNHPGAPWMWREDWARGEIFHEEGTAAIVAMSIFGILWNSVVLIIAIAFMRASNRDNSFVGIFLGLFGLIGLLLAGAVVRMILQRLRFGRSSFSLDALPATPGGQIAGVVRAPAAVGAAQAVEVTLQRVALYRGGKHSSENVEWQDVLALSQSSLDRGPTGVAIPIAFDIPADAAPTTDVADSRRRTVWRLGVKAALSGADYEAQFEVPVFHTDTVQRFAAAGTAPVRARSLAPGETPQPVSSRIRVEPMSGGTALQFPVPSWLLGWILVPGLFVPVAAWLGKQPFLVGTPYPLLVAGAAAATLFFWGLSFLGVIITPNRIEIAHGRVVVRRGLGRFGWGRTIALGDVASAVVKTVGNSGQVQQSVDILTRSGGQYWAAISLRDAGEAKWLAGEIERLARAAQGRGQGV